MGELFSEESMKHLSEPDMLDKYIRVANPGAWLVVAGVVLVLIALIVWGCLGSVGGVSIIDAFFGKA